MLSTLWDPLKTRVSSTCTSNGLGSQISLPPYFWSWCLQTISRWVGLMASSGRLSSSLLLCRYTLRGLSPINFQHEKGCPVSICSSFITYLVPVLRIHISCLQLRLKLYMCFNSKKNKLNIIWQQCVFWAITTFQGNKLSQNISLPKKKDFTLSKHWSFFLRLQMFS